MTHRELCIIASKYLKYQGIVPFNRCSYVVCELERIGESPDAFGVSSGQTQLIEVKVSRSDFLSDKKKHWRKYSHYGLGMYRSYLCPDGLIFENELPNCWGLLYVNESCNVRVIKFPKEQVSCHVSELRVLQSLLRREGVKPQIFSYKKYKTDK